MKKPVTHHSCAFDRRSFLKLVGMGAAGLGLRPTFGLAQTAEESDRYFALVLANGGLRSMDCWDAYEASAVVDNAYTYSSLTEISTAQSWRLPPAAVDGAAGQRIVDFASRLGIVRHTYMESASHVVGVRFAQSGVNRGDANAGPVVLANHASMGALIEGIDSTTSFSIPDEISRQDLAGPIAGTTTFFFSAFDDVPIWNHSSNGAVPTSATEASTNASAINDRFFETVIARNRELAAFARSDSRVTDWGEELVRARNAIDAGLETKIDFRTTRGPAYSSVSTVQDHGYRFAAMAQIFAEQLARVCTVSLNSFDTHTGSQASNCGELARLLGYFMYDLNTIGILEKTTILVMSDFDRTPGYNSSAGTDHYLHGSVAVFGPDIAGPFVTGPLVGGVRFTDKLAYPGAFADAGVTVDASVTRRDIWATVYSYFGLDPDDYFPSSTPIEGLFG